VTLSLMVVHRGKILHERYAPGVDVTTKTRTWSTAKSIAVTLIGMLVGLLGGLGLVFARDFLSNTIRDAEEVERYLHLDLLAAVPRYTDETWSLATEAYQNLRTALIFARRDERGQVVLVTGTAPQ